MRKAVVAILLALLFLGAALQLDAQGGPRPQPTLTATSIPTPPAFSTRPVTRPVTVRATQRPCMLLLSVNRCS